LRAIWKPLAFVLAAVLIIVLTQVEWTPKHPPHVRLPDSRQELRAPDLPRAEAFVSYVNTLERNAVTAYIGARARTDLAAYLIAVTPSTAVEPALPPVPAVEVNVSLQPCGGDLPPCYVKMRESGGDYSARNNSEPGAACGAWQIIGSTWAGYGGYSEACAAPPAVQDAKARELWAGGAGCAHWSAC
jgi:hypothetical protein